MDSDQESEYDPDKSVDEYASTYPLHDCLIKNGSVKRLNAIIAAHKPDIDLDMADDWDRNETALLLAIQYDRYEFAEALLRAGANPDMGERLWRHSDWRVRRR